MRRVMEGESGSFSHMTNQPYWGFSNWFSLFHLILSYALVYFMTVTSRHQGCCNSSWSMACGSFVMAQSQTDAIEVTLTRMSRFSRPCQSSLKAVLMNTDDVDPNHEEHIGQRMHTSCRLTWPVMRNWTSGESVSLNAATMGAFVVSGGFRVAHPLNALLLMCISLAAQPSYGTWSRITSARRVAFGCLLVCVLCRPSDYAPGPLGAHPLSEKHRFRCAWMHPGIGNHEY